jgi:hypothetical protein
MANTFLRKTSRNIGTTPTRVGSYTVGASTQTTIIGLDCSNITTNTISVDVYHSDGTDNTYIIKNAPIPSGSSLITVGGDQKVVLQTGDGIFVVSNTASSVDVVMSILEIT